MNRSAATKDHKKNVRQKGEVPLKPSTGDSRHKAASRVETLRFERLISDLSAQFVNIAPDEVDNEIEAALKQVLDFFKVDRCGLLGISPDRNRVYVTHAAYAEDIERVSGDIDLAALFPWSYEKLVVQGQPVCLAKTEELPAKAKQDRVNYFAMGIRSFLDIPLFFEGHVSSIIVINAVRKHRSWPAEYIPRLRLLGEIFINALERRNADRALRESGARLSLATEAAGVLPWNLDVGSGRIWTTEKAKEFLGFAPDSEMSFEDFLNAVHSEDRETLRRTLEEAMQSGKDSSTEYRIVRPDGSLRWILSRRRPYPAAPGVAARLMGVTIDITERKLAEAARLESMARYRAVVEAFDGFLYICSQDYRVEFMNQRLIERTGRDATGELCYRALHDCDSVCSWCVNDRVFRGETVRWEVQSPKDHRWYYVVNTPILRIDGTISKQSMIIDITDRKLLEIAMKDAETVLRNSQKDLQRLAGRLISAQEDELRRLSRELHDDLTQRLAVIAIEAGKLELELNNMQHIPPGPAQKISQVKEQLIKVSEDVHRISRQLHPTILDDLGLVRAIESECAALMSREDIEIIFRAEDVPDVIAEDIALCLFRVIQEGLRNVIAHSHAKSCEIFLKGVDDTLCLTVSDDGVGFDPGEVRQKPGLGLSSMRERAQLVQGDFSIRSQPGQGSVIRICVPLKEGGE